MEYSKVVLSEDILEKYKCTLRKQENIKQITLPKPKSTRERRLKQKPMLVEGKKS